MTLGMGCFLGLTYAAVFIGALRFKELRNEWSFTMLLAVIGLGMFAIAQLMVQLPWIIVAAGVASIPFAIAIRIVVPVFLPGRREEGYNSGLPHQPTIEIEPPARRRLPNPLKRLRG